MKLIEAIKILGDEYKSRNGKYANTVVISEANLLALMKENGLFKPENYWQTRQIPPPLPIKIIGLNVEIDNTLTDKFAIVTERNLNEVEVIE